MQKFTIVAFTAYISADLLRVLKGAAQTTYLLYTEHICATQRTACIFFNEYNTSSDWWRQRSWHLPPLLSILSNEKINFIHGKNTSHFQNGRGHMWVAPVFSMQKANCSSSTLKTPSLSLCSTGYYRGFLHPPDLIYEGLDVPKLALCKFKKCNCWRSAVNVKINLC